MSKAVLISIQPKWCELIFSRRKTLELRKSVPKIDLPFKCYIYMSQYSWSFDILRRYGMDDLADRLLQESGQVVGEFVCEHILGHCEMANADLAEQQSLVRREKIREYSNEKEVFGWHISDLVIYGEPKKLTDFIRPSGGCCNEGKCTGCEFLDKGNGYNVEDDCFADFDTDMYSIVKRPPQSWCYVEEVKSL